VPTEEGCIKELKRLYPEHTDYKDTLYSNWPANPVIRTGYASPEINQILDIGKKLNDPLFDRLFFAGEHTDMAFFGYMEGALRSGERAAIDLMRKKCGLPAQPATQPPSQTFVARAAPTREHGPFRQQIGIASEGESGAQQGWERSAEDQLTLRPNQEEEISLETETLPFSESGTVNPARNILFVSTGTGDDLKDAIRLVGQGHDVLAISPGETASARTFRRAGGKFVSARIEDLPHESCRFDLIRENHPYPWERNYSSARPFALARLSRLNKGGRWILVTKSPRYAALLRAVGDFDETVRRNFKVIASSLGPNHAPSTVYPDGEARFRLIFQRRR
jgi:SAM-dependent methyltransferase